MDLNAVKPGVTYKSGAVLPLLHDLPDLFERQCMTLYFWIPYPSIFRGRIRRLAVELICIAPCAAAQLGEDLAAICFAAIGKRAGRRDDMIMIPIMPENALTEVSSEIALTDDYHAGAALCTRFEVSYLILGKSTVAVGHKRAHCGHDDTVLDFAFTDAERCEQ